MPNESPKEYFQKEKDSSKWHLDESFSFDIYTSDVVSNSVILTNSK